MDWYPWYPEIYASKTMHLSAEQDGIYRRLLDQYMCTRHPLPDNDAALARISGVSLECWADASRIVRAFFSHGRDGLLHHDFCDQQLNAQDKRSTSRSESASIAAKKRWENHKVKCDTHTDSNADAMRSDATGQDKTRQKEKEPKGSSKKISTERPPDVSEDVWRDFIAHRRAKSAPATPTVLRQIRAEAEKAGMTLEAALAEMCARGWQGFKAEWISQPKGPKNGTHQPNKTKSERLAAAGDEWLRQREAEYAAEDGSRPAIAPPAEPEHGDFQRLREGTGSSSEHS